MIPYILLSWVPSTKKTIDFELSEVRSIKKIIFSPWLSFYQAQTMGENTRVSQNYTSKGVTWSLAVNMAPFNLGSNLNLEAKILAVQICS